MIGIYLTSTLGKALEVAVKFTVIVFLTRVAIIVGVAALIICIAKKDLVCGE